MDKLKLERLVNTIKQLNYTAQQQFETTKQHTLLTLKDDSKLYYKELRKYQKQKLVEYFKEKSLNEASIRYLLKLATSKKCYGILKKL